jgi:hypothetical protein
MRWRFVGVGAMMAKKVPREQAFEKCDIADDLTTVDFRRRYEKFEAHLILIVRKKNSMVGGQRLIKSWCHFGIFR